MNKRYFPIIILLFLSFTSCTDKGSLLTKLEIIFLDEKDNAPVANVPVVLHFEDRHMSRNNNNPVDTLYSNSEGYVEDYILSREGGFYQYEILWQVKSDSSGNVYSGCFDKQRIAEARINAMAYYVLGRSINLEIDFSEWAQNNSMDSVRAMLGHDLCSQEIQYFNSMKAGSYTENFAVYPNTVYYLNVRSRNDSLGSIQNNFTIEMFEEDVFVRID